MNANLVEQGAQEHEGARADLLSFDSRVRQAGADPGFTEQKDWAQATEDLQRLAIMPCQEEHSDPAHGPLGHAGDASHGLSVYRWIHVGHAATLAKRAVGRSIVHEDKFEWLGPVLEGLVKLFL